MYGTLTVVTGGMFAGKTTYLINRVAKMPAIVFKPKMDTRYSDTDCISHDGNRVSAIAVELPDELIIAEGNKLICFDEIQFFHPPYYGGDIAKAIKVFLAAGKDVLACGLDTDWKGDPFPVTGSLLAMADEVIKLRARCGVCNAAAGKSYKRTSIESNSLVELGSGDIYEARCNKHWGLQD